MKKPVILAKLKKNLSGCNATYGTIVINNTPDVYYWH